MEQSRQRKGNKTLEHLSQSGWQVIQVEIKPGTFLSHGSVDREWGESVQKASYFTLYYFTVGDMFVQ